MSLQAGIWNRELLIEILEALPKDKHSAWDVELEGTTIVNNNNYKVFGTRQNLVRYINGANDANGVQTNFSGATAEDIEIMQKYIKLQEKK